MVDVTKVEVPVVPRWGYTKTSTTGYLYENLLTDNEFTGLNNYWEQIQTHGIDFDQTLYKFKGRTFGIANQRSFNTKYDRKIFELTEFTDYWYQTTDTIRQYAAEKALANLHPRIIQIINKIKTLPPFNENPDDWIIFRGLVNVLIYDQLLAIHLDSNPLYFKSKMDEIDFYSITIYLNEITHGGEFWIEGDPGFVLTPKINTAFAFPGSHVAHGVNQNKDENQTTRRAITLRIANVNSLYLPGKPDEFNAVNPLVYNNFFDKKADS